MKLNSIILKLCFCISCDYIITQYLKNPSYLNCFIPYMIYHLIIDSVVIFRNDWWHCAVLNFEINADKNIVEEAINIFSFENCYGRKRGTEDINNSEARKGQIGDYRNHFTMFHNIIFWAICGQEAKLAGYLFNGATTIEPKN